MKHAFILNLSILLSADVWAEYAKDSEYAFLKKGPFLYQCVTYIGVCGDKKREQCLKKLTSFDEQVELVAVRKELAELKADEMLQQEREKEIQGKEKAEQKLREMERNYYLFEAIRALKAPTDCSTQIHYWGQRGGISSCY